MIDDNGRPILMDFGSAMKARVKIENRSQALLQQDIAAEQSTMAYRAPELFDVKTGITIDEKVDIWVCSFIHVIPRARCAHLDKVSGMHPLCPCLLAFAVREHTNDGTGRINSDGCHECSVQAPRLTVLRGPQATYR
jgi:serine/threonine protein kinase